MHLNIEKDMEMGKYTHNINILKSIVKWDGRKIKPYINVQS